MAVILPIAHSAHSQRARSEEVAVVEAVAGSLLSPSLSLLMVMAVAHSVAGTANTGEVAVVEAMARAPDEGVAVVQAVALASERELAPLQQQ